MQTKVYIDGYNFYYGCLKGTHYKWLDYYTLFNNFLLKRNGLGNPKLSEGAIKLFTAPIHGRVAMDENSVSDQHSYHTALGKHLSEKLQIINGHYDVSKSKAKLFKEGLEPKDSPSVEVWKIEEKQSDVNVAVEAIYDALTTPALEQVVFVSNDTDILPAIKKLQIYRDTTGRDLKIGVVIPRREARIANKSLIDAADWHIASIKDEEFIKSQLPNRIVAGRKAAFKPISWYESPDLVVEINSLLKSAFGKMNAAYHWLESTPQDYPETLPELLSTPYEEMNSEQGAQRVLEHVRAILAYKNSINSD
ncbi:NYN domain-containing protein [Saccharobesus litoralis]|uniref:NYN domain-containing protein n=1 Tax=Saccharobesus litoralis TaxID=2172099 RepID=A0A2S0VWZ0_9ALTE|nr:NYN domain-containing protein [Saccharobesus litoralis]AWB68620.1 NYN domain-containing protein [Saccharobesus litoralis]